MSGKRDERQVQQVAEAITGLLAESVKETIAQRSPEPARGCVRPGDDELRPFTPQR